MSVAEAPRRDKIFWCVRVGRSSATDHFECIGGGGLLHFKRAQFIALQCCLFPICEWADTHSDENVAADAGRLLCC